MAAVTLQKALLFFFLTLLGLCCCEGASLAVESGARARCCRASHRSGLSLGSAGSGGRLSSCDTGA